MPVIPDNRAPIHDDKAGKKWWADAEMKEEGDDRVRPWKDVLKDDIDESMDESDKSDTVPLGDIEGQGAATLAA